MSGKKAEKALEKAGVTVNKNTVPFDQKSPFITSGVRIGTPALTTRGMKVPEMEKIADLMCQVLADYKNETVLSAVREETRKLCEQFPLYADLRK